MIVLNIDTINYRPYLNETVAIDRSQEDHLVINGWCIDQESLVPIRNIIVKIGSQYFTPELNKPRHDVVEGLKTTKVLNSGFEIAIPCYLIPESETKAEIICTHSKHSLAKSINVSFSTINTQSMLKNKFDFFYQKYFNIPFFKFLISLFNSSNRDKYIKTKKEEASIKKRINCFFRLEDLKDRPSTPLQLNDKFTIVTIIEKPSQLEWLIELLNTDYSNKLNFNIIIFCKNDFELLSKTKNICLGFENISIYNFENSYIKELNKLTIYIKNHFIIIKPHSYIDEDGILKLLEPIQNNFYINSTVPSFVDEQFKAEISDNGVTKLNSIELDKMQILACNVLSLSELSRSGHNGSIQSTDKFSIYVSHSSIARHEPRTHFLPIDDKNTHNFIHLIHFLRKKDTSNKFALFFDHDLGGGTHVYLNNSIKKYKNQNINSIVSKYNTTANKYFLEFYFDDTVCPILLNTIEDIYWICENLDITTLILNNIVSYPHPNQVLKIITETSAKHKTKVNLNIHDYFCICPSCNLLDNNDIFCIYNKTKCENCFQSNVNPINIYRDIRIDKWRKTWKHFFESCDNITVFSNSSKEIMLHFYPDLNQDIISVVPHKVDYLSPVQKQVVDKNIINIGILGVLVKLKGSDIVSNMIDIIKEKDLNIKFTLIGTTHAIKNSRHFKSTGKYIYHHLHDIISEHKIDLFLQPSICPETFSYTCEEIVQMDMPLAVFNIGAQKERIENYDKGVLIDKVDAETALDKIIEWSEQHGYTIRKQ